MKAAVSCVKQLKESAVDDETDIKDLIEHCSIDDPDIVFLFPATQIVSSEEFSDKLQELDNALDCPLVGVSIGGFATNETQALNTHGVAAVFLKDIDFEIERIEDAYQIDEEEAKQLMQNSHTAFTFETGAWGPSEGNMSIWSTISSYSSKVLARDLLGKNQYILTRLRNRLKKLNIGYSSVFNARLNLLREHKDILNFNSGDMGDFREGYEIFGSEITEGKSATIVKTSEDIDYGVSGDKSLAFENERVLETFEDISHSDYVLYGFNGKTLSELAKEYPIHHQVGEGNFMYYFIIEMPDIQFSIPINADLDIIISNFYLKGIERAHLVRSPSFSEYMTQFEKTVTELDGLPHISINPPQVASFRAKINEVVEKSQEELDEFLITTDNAQRGTENFEYNFSKYLIYK